MSKFRNFGLRDERKMRIGPAHRISSFWHCLASLRMTTVGCLLLLYKTVRPMRRDVRPELRKRYLAVGTGGDQAIGAADSHRLENGAGVVVSQFGTGKKHPLPAQRTGGPNSRSHGWFLEVSPFRFFRNGEGTPIFNASHHSA